MAGVPGAGSMYLTEFTVIGVAGLVALEGKIAQLCCACGHDGQACTGSVSTRASPINPRPAQVGRGCTGRGHWTVARRTVPPRLGRGCPQRGLADDCGRGLGASLQIPPVTDARSSCPISAVLNLTVPPGWPRFTTTDLGKLGRTPLGPQCVGKLLGMAAWGR